MKKIGLIGGMSWESTLLYYKLLNEKVKQLRGGSHSANCVIESVDFAEIAELQANDDWPALDSLMQERANSLVSSGAEMILVCANTMHLCVPAIEQCTTIPVIHIAEVTADEIKAFSLKKIALLGTKFTMEKAFFKDILQKRGIEVLVPDPSARNQVHDIIYNELIHGIMKEESKRIYISVIQDLISQGAEGVILGCTEIPLLIYPEDIDIPLFNTTKLHAEKAVEFALSAS
ncbi:aspartate/glutamate racemase family protein [Lutimonas sp.]|uniref:aspartate/glutamate racemase family protein n=1 Tax=Lutimonas sp. TaxID=1872403 RepID=UPI003D9B85D1